LWGEWGKGEAQAAIEQPLGEGGGAGEALCMALEKRRDQKRGGRGPEGGTGEKSGPMEEG